MFQNTPTCLLMDAANQRFYVADDIGNIFIYRMKMKLKLLHLL